MVSSALAPLASIHAEKRSEFCFGLEFFLVFFVCLFSICLSAWHFHKSSYLGFLTTLGDRSYYPYLMDEQVRPRR